MNNKLVGYMAVVLAVVAILIAAAGISKVPGFGNTTSSFWDATSYKVSGTSVIDSSRGGAFTTLSASSLATLNAGQLRSYTNSTTSAATTYTLVQADILNYDTVLATLSGGATTWTLPASSTLTSFIPTAGDMAEQCYLPTSNNLTFAAGTGIDLQVATSSSISGAYDVTITSGGMGCMKYVRQADSDITAALTEYENGD